ncbi:MAG: fluoride efflux transporter CrcB [bacterium]|nr:fluoride efflux transporter CrcB [bacterium]
MKKIVLVMLGGSLGALLRYSISFGAAKLIGSRFAWGTLIANLTGCFIIGMAFALVDRTNILGPSARLFFMTGFLGALTTFSTYALETVNFAATGKSTLAVSNFLVNNIGGATLVLAGMWLVHLITQGE